MTDGEASWHAARWRVASEALWAAVERGESRRQDRVQVEVSDLRLALEKLGDRLVGTDDEDER